MKKFFIVVLAILAVFVGYIVLFNINDDVWYETHVQMIGLFGKQDGIYCLTPYTCMDVIHDSLDLWHMSMEYADKYGSSDPGRPNLLYEYNSDMKVYIRWLHY